MRMSDPIKSFDRRARTRASAHLQTDVLSSVAVAGAVAMSGPLPTNLLIPDVRILLFVLALVFALVAWVRCSTDEYRPPAGMRAVRRA
jgi:hypothetical protein